jgi:hypothetical protein
MKFLDFQDNFFVSVVAFDFPSSEIEENNLLCGELLGIIKVGEQHGDRPIRTDESNDPEFQSFEILSLFLWNLAQVVVARVNTYLVFFFSALNESLYGGKRALSGTSKKEIAAESSHEKANQFVARVPSIKEQHTSRRDVLQEGLHFIAFGRMRGDHSSCDGKSSENIVRGGNEALGIMSLSRVLEAAVGVKGVSDLVCCGKSVFGPVKGEDRHAVPSKARVVRAYLVGQFHGIVEYIPKHMPGNFLARFGERSVVYGFGFRPKATSLGSSKEFTRFHVHSLALSTCNNGE